MRSASRIHASSSFGSSAVDASLCVQALEGGDELRRHTVEDAIIATSADGRARGTDFEGRDGRHLRCRAAGPQEWPRRRKPLLERPYGAAVRGPRPDSGHARAPVRSNGLISDGSSRAAPPFRRLPRYIDRSS